MPEFLIRGHSIQLEIPERSADATAGRVPDGMGTRISKQVSCFVLYKKQCATLQVPVIYMKTNRIFFEQQQYGNLSDCILDEVFLQQVVPVIGFFQPFAFYPDNP